MFMCDLRGINQAQVKERPHTSVLEELLRCTAMKGTQLPYQNTGSHFFGVQPRTQKAASSAHGLAQLPGQDRSYKEGLSMICAVLRLQNRMHFTYILQISYYRSLTASQLGIYDIYSRKETKNYKSHLLSPPALERTTTLSLPRSSQLKPRCKKLSCAEERNAICSLFQRWGHWVVVHKGQVQM